jgi:benzoate membrane transport protein
LSAVSAGFIAVLVGFASAMAIVFQAALACGASQEIIVSWVWALGIGMGAGCIGLSWFYKRPIIIAWSTPGAALLATSLTVMNINQAIGVFIFVAVLTLLTGLSGWFDKLTKCIPLPLASAMLAGILLQFGLDLFGAWQVSPLMVSIMLVTYILARRLLPRFAILAVLLSGFICAHILHLIDYTMIRWEMAQPVWVTPQFKISHLIGIGLPLFIVTMTSQNIPGVAVLKSSGYKQQPISPIISWSGLLNLVLEPFGGFSFNMAAITAAICTSEEAHQDPDKRYVAGIATGVFNIIAGIAGAAVVSLMAAFPAALISALAGLALLGTIGTSLLVASQQSHYREAAMITFLVTASGLSFFGIASAFWGIVLGMLALLANNSKES